MVPKSAELLPLLVNANVEFIVVGGLAATAHGSARSTNDVDIVYKRSHENIHALAMLLSKHNPSLRGAPPGLPFRLDEQTLKAGLNFTLTTDIGDIDLLGEIAGGGRYEDLLPHTLSVQAFGTTCLFLGLEKLIEVKFAAGRPKDLEVMAELRALLEERSKQ